ncbi:transporter substrate-binding domain-containing protein [Rheinheimera sediminis]|uniref:transporter substrate-binding domain-containing protein n=1 Tax=Rheinheimera sp. YQF-1 TaxID=2499626 RepID=UPI000FD70336|nr:transporter substrate-binding domain-containing protein [Rheinheimera sp. YQF-1]RVT48147.1 transporter substrate-binding domain-containing protein [Rheinheimera sp. YQF-1]
MRFLVFCLFCIGFCPALAAERDITVGASNNLPADHPSIVLMQQVYQQCGYNMVLIVMPLERSAHESNKGHILDAELSRTAEAAEILPNMLRIDVPIGYVRITAFSRDPQLQINHWQDLSAFRVDVLRGIYLAKINMQGLVYTEVNSVSQAIQRLLSDRTDVVVALGDETEKLLKQQATQGIYTITPDLAKTQIYHYVHQRHAALVPQLEAALRQLVQPAQL